MSTVLYPLYELAGVIRGDIKAQVDLAEKAVVLSRKINQTIGINSGSENLRLLMDAQVTLSHLADRLARNAKTTAEASTKLLENPDD